jgi:hypothetical protein
LYAKFAVLAYSEFSGPKVVFNKHVLGYMNSVGLNNPRSYAISTLKAKTGSF